MKDYLIAALFAVLSLVLLGTVALAADAGVSFKNAAPVDPRTVQACQVAPEAPNVWTKLNGIGTGVNLGYTTRDLACTAKLANTPAAADYATVTMEGSYNTSDYFTLQGGVINGVGLTQIINASVQRHLSLRARVTGVSNSASPATVTCHPAQVK